MELRAGWLRKKYVMIPCELHIFSNVDYSVLIIIIEMKGLLLFEMRRTNKNLDGARK